MLSRLLRSSIAVSSLSALPLSAMAQSRRVLSVASSSRSATAAVSVEPSLGAAALHLHSGRLGRQGSEYILSQRDIDSYHSKGYIALPAVLSEDELRDIEHAYMKFMNRQIRQPSHRTHHSAYSAAQCGSSQRPQRASPMEWSVLLCSGAWKRLLRYERSVRSPLRRVGYHQRVNTHKHTDTHSFTHSLTHARTDRTALTHPLAYVRGCVHVCVVGCVRQYVASRVLSSAEGQSVREEGCFHHCTALRLQALRHRSLSSQLIHQPISPRCCTTRELHQLSQLIDQLVFLSLSAWRCSRLRSAAGQEAHKERRCVRLACGPRIL